MVQDIIIGKYTLESLTNGMYSSAFDLFREYIQNSVDSIDQAVKLGVINNNESSINITVDTDNGVIRFEDNGIGVSKLLASKILLDIGNSTKSRNSNRGFRGIGRLSGLGYCQKLVFTTSVRGENTKTIISFDAEELKVLLTDNTKNETVNDVLQAVVNIKEEAELETNHYFIVELIGVNNSEKLLDYERVKKYLVQNLPLDFSTSFKWGSYIKKKINSLGYSITSYGIKLSDGKNVESLVKGYEDKFVSDRVKHFEKSIKDIDIIPITDDDYNLIAILWYAVTDYSGTILDDKIKGIRVRQGNILIGDKNTATQYFKEERFNGWLLGELYIVSNKLVPNARRDDFENTIEYQYLKTKLLDWSADVAKTIRKISYERNASEEKKKIVECNDVNDLLNESMSFLGDAEEFDSEVDEMSYLAENELFNKFNVLLEKRNCNTKYVALNLRNDIPLEQKKILEKVFDIICGLYDKKKAEVIITELIGKYK